MVVSETERGIVLSSGGLQEAEMWMKYFWSKMEAAVFAAFVSGKLSVCGNGRFKVEWKGAV